MRKIILSLTLIIASLTAFSQVTISPGVRIGVNFANIANIDHNINYDNKTITNFHAGVLIALKFNDFYTLQPEILYSKQGSKLEALGFNDSRKINLDYLSIPVINKLFIGKSNFHFEIAPIIDILLNSKNVDNPKSLDFGLLGGIGFEFPIGITVNARYKQGLIDILGRNVDTGDGFETTDVSSLFLNKVIQLSVSYKFNFSK